MHVPVHPLPEIVLERLQHFAENVGGQLSRRGYSGRVNRVRRVLPNLLSEEAA